MYLLELEKLIDSKAKGKPIAEKPIEKVQGTQDLAASEDQKLRLRTIM
jgi:hypothetical protein